MSERCIGNLILAKQAIVDTTLCSTFRKHLPFCRHLKLLEETHFGNNNTVDCLITIDGALRGQLVDLFTKLPTLNLSKHVEDVLAHHVTE